MFRRDSSDFDSEPHTLRSCLPSHGIPICKPSHPSSLSLESNLLEISQSPTRGFVTQEHKSQCKMSSVQACSMNANLQIEKSHSGSVPLDKSDLVDTTNQTGSASNTLAETTSTWKEMLISKEKSNEQSKEQEHKRLSPKDDLRISPCISGNPSTGLSHEPSVGTSFPDNSNPSPPESVVPLSIVPSSDVLSSLKFFSFVILHVPEDQEEAIRVCGILRNLGIGEGTTFCEGFQIAGVSPLKCLQDAVENSAYIVLLLTTGFLSKWGEFQTNMVLMNSIEDENRSGTIIPFFPRDKAPRSKLPLALSSLISLNETSSRFETQVQNTFKPNMIKRQRERWEIKQQSEALTKCLQDAQDIASCHEKREALRSLLSEIFIGQGSVIHINNASNVQIGNQNTMNVQQTTNVPQMELSGHQEFHNEFQT